MLLNTKSRPPIPPPPPPPPPPPDIVFFPESSEDTQRKVPEIPTSLHSPYIGAMQKNYSINLGMSVVSSQTDLWTCSPESVQAVSDVSAPRCLGVFFLTALFHFGSMIWEPGPFLMTASLILFSSWIKTESMPGVRLHWRETIC